jgi:transposase
MRYELSEFEWAAIKPMPPNKPRGYRNEPLPGIVHDELLNLMV